MSKPSSTAMLRIATTLIALCLLALPTKADEAYTFTSYNSLSGFVQREVMDITQDADGVMWFATRSGLYRYDGVQFTNYKARPGDGTRLESNRLDRLIADGHTIWLRGYDGIISCFSVRRHTITPLPIADHTSYNIYPAHDGGVWALLQDGRVTRAWVDIEPDTVCCQLVTMARGLHPTALKADRQGRMWTLGARGLWVAEGRQAKARLVDAHATAYDMAEDESRKVFALDGGTLLCIAQRRLTRHKLPTSARLTEVASVRGGGWLVATSTDGLFLLDARFATIAHFTTANSPLNGHTVMGLHTDSRGGIWFATGAPGVMRFDPSSHTLAHLEMEGEFSSEPSVWTLEPTLAENSRGELWVSCSGHGLARYNWEANRLETFFDSSKQRAWVSENTLAKMFIDRQDNLWFCGKYTGLEKATLTQSQFYSVTLGGTTESSSDVRGLFQDSHGRIWMGAKDGRISVMDASLQPLGILTRDGRIAPGATDAMGRAYCFAEQADGTLWIGTKFGGLLRLAPRADGSYHIQRFTADGGPYSLPHDDIFCLAIDHHQRLWIATYGAGLCYVALNDANHRFIHAGNLLTGYPKRDFMRTRYVTIDRHDRLWLGTTGGLLSASTRFGDPRRVTFEVYRRDPDNARSLSYNDVLQVMLTRKGKMYVLTNGGGFCRVTRQKDGSLDFMPFTVANGLRSDILYAGQEDAHGQLWMATENGLVKFSPANDRIETFPQRLFGKQIDLTEGPTVALRDGRLLFPSRNYGAMCFSPSEVSVSNYVPRVLLSSLTVAQTPVEPSSDHDALLRQDIDQTTLLTLPHDRNNFTIAFSALDFRDPSNISYAYRLVGLETEWNLSGNTPRASYANLAPGTYRLQVRSTNSDGRWVDNMRELTIVVKPSFWQTGWAWLLYVVTLASVLVGAAWVLWTFVRLKDKVRVEQEISDLKMKFFTDISHELRTPLTLIAGTVREMLRRGAPDRCTEESLLVVDRNASRLLRLINQLLDLRRLQGGGMRLKLRQIDLGGFVEQLAANFTTMAADRHISLSVAKPRERVAVWADRDKIDKVVFNLLSNAFRFTPAGKAIRVAVEAADKGGARIVVADEGSGISPEKQATIFNMFATDSEGAATSQPGSGVGLALAKELVELHKGTIGVTSQPGHGATFVVTLPSGAPTMHPAECYLAEDSTRIAAPQVPAATPMATASPTAAPAAPASEGRRQLLVVDDNSDMRHFVASLFTPSYEVTTAADGREGLQLAIERLPDLVVTDLMMPEMDGMTMARELRHNAATSHIPLVILSAKTDEESKIEGFETGIDAYVEKPFSADILRARVAQLIRRQQQMQQLAQSHYIEAQPAADYGLPKVDQEFLERVTQVLTDHLDDAQLSVDQVAQLLGMSRSVYFKKLKALTGLGPNDYLKRLRMHRAAELIDTQRYAMADVATLVGFSDARYLSRCFKLQYGMTPTEWKARSRNGQ